MGKIGSHWEEVSDNWKLAGDHIAARRKSFCRIEISKLQKKN